MNYQLELDPRKHHVQSNYHELELLLPPSFMFTDQIYFLLCDITQHWPKILGVNNKTVLDYLYSGEKVCDLQHALLVQLWRQAMFVLAPYLQQDLNPSKVKC